MGDNVMRALVVYESVFGNTHHVAEAVGAGLAESPGAEVDVVAVDDASTELLSAADLVVVGGPTHGHGMARSSTKEQGAEKERAKAVGGEPAHELDDQACGDTLRHWFDELGSHQSGPAAAFDTRLSAPTLVTGQASHGIRRRLRHHGWAVDVAPESYLVDKENELLDGELERARAWGRTLGTTMPTNTIAPT